LLFFEFVKKASMNMKKFFGKFLPVIAFVFAIGAAFASQPDKVLVGTLKANVSGTWTTISEQQRYSCASNPNIDCVARFDAQNQMIPGTLVKGVYTPQ
jgi:hypothetical protein